MENQKSALGLDPNVTSLVGYIIGLVALIVIFIEKDNKTVRFHAFQSLLYWVVAFVVLIVLSIVSGVMYMVSTVLGGLISLLILLVFFGFFAGACFFGYRAFKGESFKLPMVGDMAEKWSA